MVCVGKPSEQARMCAYRVEGENRRPERASRSCLATATTRPNAKILSILSPRYITEADKNAQ